MTVISVLFSLPYMIVIFISMGRKDTDDDLLPLQLYSFGALVKFVDPEDVDSQRAKVDALSIIFLFVLLVTVVIIVY